MASRDAALAVGCGVGVVSLSGLPDCDRRLPLVAHHGITHTLAFRLVVAAVLGWLGAVLVGFLDGLGVPSAPGSGADRTGFSAVLPGVIVVTVAVGSHLLADALTPSGVPLLWPVSDRRYAASLTPASDPLANGTC